MKGLLLKDWFMLKKYCRSYLLILVVFCAISMVNTENSFFILYPMVLLGLLPVTLIAYDERSRWDVYCGTLPITRDQQVSGKYLMLLIMVGAGLVLTSLVQAVQMIRGGGFDVQEFLLMEVTLVTLGVMCPAIMLPIVYKFGSEKGRMMYFVVIIAVCAITFSVDSIVSESYEVMEKVLRMKALPVMMLGLSLLVLAFSWRLSMVFYRKREL